MKNQIEKNIVAPPVSRWQSQDTIEGRFTGWASCVIILGLVSVVGPFYVAFGDRFDKRVSDSLARLGDWIGI